MAAIWDELKNAPFIADVGPDDRKIGRLIGATAAGIGAALAGMVLVLLLAGIAFAVYLGASGQADPTAITEQMQSLISDPAHEFTFNEVMAVLIGVGVGNSVLFLSFVVVAALILKRPLKTYVTAAQSFRWRLLLLGMLLFVVVLGPLLALGAWLDPNMPTYPMFRLTENTASRFLFALVAVLCLIPAAFAEEIVFRGWLLKHVAAFTRNPVVLLAINGVLFSLMHYPDIGPSAFIARTIMGAGFCYMVLRLGGLEFATGAHAANNILLLLFVQPLTIAPQPGQPFMPLMAFGALAEVAGYVAITEIAVRWKALSVWAGSNETVPVERVFD